MFGLIPVIDDMVIYYFFLIFVRIGGGLMVMPGIGELYVSPRIRLSIALLLSLAIYSPVVESLPPMPTSALSLFLLFVGETIIGIFFGLMVRIIMSTLHTAGMIIAYQSGLAAAMMFDHSQGTQGSLFGNFLGTFALILLFAMNLHHVLLYTLVESYSVFLPGAPPPIGEFSEYTSHIVSDTFKVGFQLASPHIIIGLILYLGAGILSRLMPAMQIFFILLPLQIIISFIILMLTLTVTLRWYMGYMEDNLLHLL